MKFRKHHNNKGYRQIKNGTLKKKTDLLIKKLKRENIMNNENKKGGRVEAEVSPDFWRTFTRKLVNEYKTMCEEKSKDGFNGNSEYYLASVILEPIIDALIKTETELDNLANYNFLCDINKEN